jgi:hypothetical protein
MSATIFSNATRTTRFAKPADTNAATMYTVESLPRAHLDSLNIASTGAASYTVWINDGTTDYLLADAISLGANARVDLDFGQPVLLEGWSVKVKTSSANNLTFALQIAEHYRMTTGFKV